MQIFADSGAGQPAGGGVINEIHKPPLNNNPLTIYPIIIKNIITINSITIIN